MKNKKRADIYLIVAAVLFAGMCVIHYFYKDNMYVQLCFFVAECALVGSVADWFAVTALFKNPIPFLPFRHTAIIPASREKIINGVVSLVENELLSKKIMKDKVQNVAFVDMFITWSENEKGSAYFQSIARYLLSSVFTNIDVKQLALYFDSVIKAKLTDWKITPILKDILEKSVQTGDVDRLLEYLLAEMTPYINSQDTKHNINYFLEQKIEDYKKDALSRIFIGLLETTNTINATEAGNVLHKQLVKTVEDLQNPEHAARIEIKNIILKAVREIEADKSIADGIEEWKENLISKIDLQDVLTPFLQSTIDMFSKPPSSVENGFFNKIAGVLGFSKLSMDASESPVMDWIVLQLKQYWEGFRTKFVLKDQLEGYFKEAVNRLIESEHYIVGDVTRETLAKFTNKDMNKFIDDKAGEDLHYIRINGTLVGGAFGAVVFLFLNFLYDPYVVPIIKDYMLKYSQKYF